MTLSNLLNVRERSMPAMPGGPPWRGPAQCRAEARRLTADSLFCDNPMAVVPFLYDLCKTVAMVMAIIPVGALLIVMTMVIRTAARDNFYRSGLGWKTCGCKRSESDCRSDKELVHGFPPVNILLSYNVA
jgi:hypothetical protein